MPGSSQGAWRRGGDVGPAAAASVNSERIDFDPPAAASVELREPHFGLSNRNSFLDPAGKVQHASPQPSR